jgi:hypothetical protein
MVAVILMKGHQHFVDFVIVALDCSRIEGSFYPQVINTTICVVRAGIFYDLNFYIAGILQMVFTAMAAP